MQMPRHMNLCCFVSECNCPGCWQTDCAIGYCSGREQSAKGGDGSLEERQQKILNFFKSSCTWKTVSYNQMRKEYRR